MNRRQRTNDLL